MFARRFVSSALIVAFAPIALGLGACGGSTGTNAASQVLKKPELPTDNEAKCSVRKSQAEPLIVEWPNAARGRLESTLKRGLVAIKYEGCELTQLPACTVKASAVGPYAYWPVTKKQSKVAIKDADDLYASMPVGAVKLEGKLKSAGELDVAMTIIGRYEAPTRTIYRSDLEGTDCDQATHVIAALTVGAFTFSAGADAEVGAGATVGVAGGGAKSSAKRETLQSDGDESACARASATDKGPPEGCGALLQIEVASLTRGERPAPPPPVVAPPPPVEPTPPRSDPWIAPPVTKKPKCKKGEHVEDNVCVKNGKKGTKPSAVAAAAVVCAAGQHKEGTKCVDDPPPEPVAPPPAPAPAPTKEIQCAEGQHREGDACVSDREQPMHSRPDASEATREKTPARYTQEPEATEHPNPWRTLLGYGAAGAGIVWSTAGLLAIEAAGKAKDGCNDVTKTCGPDAIDARKQAVGAALVADIALGVGAAMLIGFFLVPKTVKVGATASPHGGIAAATWWWR